MGRAGLLKVMVAAACAAAVSLGPPGGLAQPRAENVTEVAPVTVAGSIEAPLLPLVGRRPAPNLSVEQMASEICVNQIEPKFFDATVRAAYEATVRARQARINGPLGKITEKQMRDAETAREDAVNRLGPYKFSQAFSEARRDLKIDGLSFQRVRENTSDVLEVGLTVHSLSGARIELPPVTLISIDEQGFVLAGQTSQLDELFIEPGANAYFTIRFHNPPTYTRTLKAVFAPPFSRRGYRGCGSFDPLAGGTGGAVLTPAAAASADPTAPPYTGIQLALMQNWWRAFAQGGFENPQNSDASCDRPGQRRWRQLMIVSDRLDEAWVATAAADQVRRGAAAGVFLPEDIEAAELARRAAVRAFMTVQFWRPSALPQYSDLGVSVRMATKIGDNFQIDIIVANGARMAVPTPPVRISAVDKYGAIVAETIQRDRRPVPPGGGISFRTDLVTPAGLVAGIKADLAC